MSKHMKAAKPLMRYEEMPPDSSETAVSGNYNRREAIESAHHGDTMGVQINQQSKREPHCYHARRGEIDGEETSRIMAVRLMEQTSQITRFGGFFVALFIHVEW